MSRSMIVAALALSLCAGAAAADPALDATFAEHVRAVQARDMAALEKTLTAGEQLTLILPNGTHTETKAGYLAFHKAFFASKTWTIRFDPISQIVGPDFAVLTTKSLYQDVDEGKPVQTRSWVTFTFRKEVGGWKLVHDQNTRVPAGT